MPKPSICQRCRSSPWGPTAFDDFGLSNSSLAPRHYSYEVTKERLLASLQTECPWCEIVYDAALWFKREEVDDSETFVVGMSFEKPDMVDTTQFSSLILSVSFRNPPHDSVSVRFPIFTRSSPGSCIFLLENDGGESMMKTPITHQWFQGCRESHPSCVTLPPKLPSRILAVSTNEHQDVIRLHCSSDEEASYAFLSYRWGGHQHLVLEKRSLHAFQGGIYIKDLPPTLKDAVRATRDLGLSYLWIDALCIIQDCPDDVEHEISMMQKYLRAATVVLFASGVKSVQDSFLDPPGRLGKPASYTMKHLGLVRNCYFEIELLFPGDQMVSLVLDASGNDFYRPLIEPLNRRGWVFQERLLCPRVLIFPSMGGLVWQCDSTERFQGRVNYDNTTGTMCRDRPLREPKPYRSRLAREITTSQSPINNSWLKMVHEYSIRDLTAPEDKLPAIAGLAQYYFDKHGQQLGSYYAGLWKNFLPRSLHWEVISGGLRKVPVPQRAPSWSWAAVDGAFYPHGLPTVIHPGYQFYTRVLHCETDLESSILPFGRVTGGKLTLEGQLVEVWWAPSNSSPTGEATLFGSEDLSLVLGTCMADCIEHVPTTTSKLIFLPLWSRTSYSPSSFSENQEERRKPKSVMMGILLKPLETETGTYARVGSFHGEGYLFFETKGQSILSIV